MRTRQNSAGRTDGRQKSLHGLLTAAQAVLFDFDGPVCGLFARNPTAPAAKEIQDLVRADWGELPPSVEQSQDSHGILRALRQDMFEEASPAGRRLETLQRAEDVVTQYEWLAIQDADLEPHVEELLGHLSHLGKRMAVVSNNAEEPIRKYLDANGLLRHFEAVIGRDHDELRNMKPNPYGVLRAVDLLDLSPGSCLMVGDQLSDLHAAESAGVPFLGTTDNDQRRAEMSALGADSVVATLEPVAACAKSLAERAVQRSDQD
ncbi:HAD-IA family hydrolase [Streptomyces sp. NBC_00569]|uniref:HAD family hydrolase n=1 Tax=unclassified Streptomyces TaxID=2593676 RepID=UPI002257C47C|nr:MULTISPECIES: HAD-IA family hydrolase [unclassified Streptomyces]MCX5438166.1 HAD-IA family hydrolase [Streptomyces sp. NBC_00063]WUB95279.1 HAD-IA family hydrolase [Streptomyces sp. NBC_00569]